MLQLICIQSSSTFNMQQGLVCITRLFKHDSCSKVEDITTENHKD